MNWAPKALETKFSQAVGGSSVPKPLQGKRNQTRTGQTRLSGHGKALHPLAETQTVLSQGSMDPGPSPPLLALIHCHIFPGLSTDPNPQAHRSLKTAFLRLDPNSSFCPEDQEPALHVRDQGGSCGAALWREDCCLHTTAHSPSDKPCRKVPVSSQSACGSAFQWEW